MSLPKKFTSYTVSRLSFFYPGYTVNLDKEFTEKYGFTNRTTDLIMVEAKTKDKILMSFVTGKYERYWIPKQQCRITKRKALKSEYRGI